MKNLLFVAMLLLVSGVASSQTSSSSSSHPQIHIYSPSPWVVWCHQEMQDYKHLVGRQETQSDAFLECKALNWSSGDPGRHYEVQMFDVQNGFASTCPVCQVTQTMKSGVIVESPSFETPMCMLKYTKYGNASHVYIMGPMPCSQADMLLDTLSKRKCLKVWTEGYVSIQDAMNDDCFTQTWLPKGDINNAYAGLALDNLASFKISVAEDKEVAHACLVDTVIYVYKGAVWSEAEVLSGKTTWATQAKINVQICDDKKSVSCRNTGMEESEYNLFLDRFIKDKHLELLPFQEIVAGLKSALKTTSIIISAKK